MAGIVLKWGVTQMNGDKILEVVNIYRNLLESSFPKMDFSHDRFTDQEPYIILAHCHGMLDQIEKFVTEGRTGKAFRWLGFIQGCLWSMGYYTLDELKNHNRPGVSSDAD